MMVLPGFEEKFEKKKSIDDIEYEHYKFVLKNVICYAFSKTRNKKKKHDFLT